MTADEKLHYLRGQIKAAEIGVSKFIHCPYCDAHLNFDSAAVALNGGEPPTCCETFALGVIAILQREEQTDMKDLADRVRSNAGGLAVFN